MRTEKKEKEDMDSMRKICVYAGSNPGVRPEYREVARTLGQELVARGLGLVYGGGRVGLMGTLAEAVTAAGGGGIGVVALGLFSTGVAYTNCTQLYEVKKIHEPEGLIADLA